MHTATTTTRASKKEEAQQPQRLFTTISGRVIRPAYTAEDLQEILPGAGKPGQMPFTRGIHETMYRGRLWTMRQFAGFGTARQTNQRFRFLLDRGQTGLSVAFDMPTLMGLDSDDPRAGGEVGRLGVAIDTVDDMIDLFDGIDMGAVSTSMTINAPAAVVMAFYLVAAEEQGAAVDGLRGTIQNDILKEFHAQNEFVFPPRPSVRLAVDVIEYCARCVPRWNPVSISGYHIREAGSTAGQELAFTLADGFEYVERMLERGMAIDAFAPRLSFFFNAHNELFEEVAKYRAARRIWATRLRERYGAADDRSCKLRFHAQTAGCSLQAQQPRVNLVRVAYQALAAVLGGCQSLHTNSYDEALCLPTEQAATMALRTQQVLAHETGVASTADPLGGSYYVEKLTDELEAEAQAIFGEIEQLGGMYAAIDAGYFRQRIAEASARYQREVESKQRVIVGVNAFVEEQRDAIEMHGSDPAVEAEQIDRLRRTMARRDSAAVKRCLEEVHEAARQKVNLMPMLTEAARRRVTIGEVMATLAEVFGRHEAATGA